MSAYEHPELVALDEVEDILVAYADARLAPSGPILSRMRATVMREAAAAAAMRDAERREAEADIELPPTRRFAVPQITLASFARPAFALGLAGLLALGTGTAVTSASPGSPLYGARVALEQAFLPTEIDARFASHTQHLDERLAEAEAAAASGNAAALEAALAAYQAEIEQTLADIGDDYYRLSSFEAALQHHIAKLTELAARLPTDVARENAAEHAIDASQRAVNSAVDKVKDKKANSNNRPASPPRQEQDPENRPAPQPPRQNLPD
jgi:hypothetical protein